METATTATRPATTADLPTIKAMIREFADYLNAIDEPEEVDQTAIDQIEQIAFGPDALCGVEVAEAGGEIAGYMVYFIAVDMDAFAPGLYVADLFVRDRWRGHGIGRVLMERAAALIRARTGRHDRRAARAETKHIWSLLCPSLLNRP